MKKIITILFCFLAFSTIQSQSIKKIETILSKAKNDKKDILTLINKLARSGGFNDAQNIANKSLSLFYELKKAKLIAKSYRNNLKKGDEKISKVNKLISSITNAESKMINVNKWVNEFIEGKRSEKERNYNKIKLNYNSFIKYLGEANNSIRKINLHGTPFG